MRVRLEPISPGTTSRHGEAIASGDVSSGGQWAGEWREHSILPLFCPTRQELIRKIRSPCGDGFLLCMGLFFEFCWRGALTLP